MMTEAHILALFDEYEAALELGDTMDLATLRVALWLLALKMAGKKHECRKEDPV